MNDAIPQRPEGTGRSIAVPNLEAVGLAPGDYDVIGEKVSHQLAQRPGSYVIPKYVRPVIKWLDTQALSCRSALSTVAVPTAFANLSNNADGLPVAPIQLLTLGAIRGNREDQERLVALDSDFSQI